ncbi:MAG: F0F1 ATP synthase subunit B [Gammaproteobacteria bacterium]
MNINATLLGQTLAFVIFVAICWKWVWPPIIAIMEEREKRISDGLEAAKKAKDSLAEAKLEYDAEISKAKTEAATILEKANERAATIVGEAKNKAELEAEKIIATANKNLEAEINKTKAQLKQDFGQIVVDTAQKIIGEEISTDKHEKIILEAAERI